MSSLELRLFFSSSIVALSVACGSAPRAQDDVTLNNVQDSSPTSEPSPTAMNPTQAGDTNAVVDPNKATNPNDTANNGNTVVSTNPNHAQTGGTTTGGTGTTTGTTTGGHATTGTTTGGQATSGSTTGTTTGAHTTTGTTTGAHTTTGTTTGGGASTGGQTPPGGGGTTGGGAPPPPATTGGTTGTADQGVAWPSLDFVDNPGGDDPDAVALTFDDGPDGESGYGGTNNTAYILDQLKALGLHGTFMLCDDVWTDVGSDPLAQEDIQRMIAEGHDVANHTYNHQNLSSISSSDVDNEFAENASKLSIPQALGSGVTMTMYRVPFGVPYQGDTSDIARVAPITAKYGVHIGWGMDSNDWACAQAGQDANCVIDNVNYQLDQGHSGILLMHAVYRLSGEALPGVVQAIYNHGKHIVSVQDMIVSKYGMTSDELYHVNAGASFPADVIGKAAENACSQNDFNIDPPYPN